MIRQLMEKKGLTRAKAKAEIKQFDLYMAGEYLKQKEQYELSLSVGQDRVRAMPAAIFLGE
jgi:hypothetical protein